MQPVRKNKLNETRTDSPSFDFRPAHVGIFHIEEGTKPDGMVYAFFVEFNQDKPTEISSALVNAERNGWRPVPADRHPELVPGYSLGIMSGPLTGFIRKGGQILLELPEEKYKMIQNYWAHEVYEKTRLAYYSTKDHNDPTVPWHVYANEAFIEQKNEYGRPQPYSPY